MEKVVAAFIVETEIGAEDDEKYNNWLDNFNIPLALKSPGMVRARRYRSVDNENQYLTVFEMENEEAARQWDQGPERKAAHQNKIEHWGEGGFKLNWAGYYKNFQV